MKLLSCSKGNNSNTDNCPDEQLISELNYTDTREDHLKKVSEYYNKVLEKYSNKYNNYLTNSNSSNIADNEDAELEMNENGEITGLNQHLIKITKELNNLVMGDAQNILIQQNKIDTEKSLIVENDNKVNGLETLLSKNNENNEYNNESLNELTKSNRHNNRNTILYIVINVLLLIIIIIGLINTKSL